MVYANEFTFTCHTASINSLSFTPDGRHLASGGDDGALIVHNCENGAESYKVKYDSPVTAILWHPHREAWLFIGHGCGKVVFMEVSAPNGFRFPVDMGNATSPVEHLSYDPDNAMLAICYRDRIVVWKEAYKDLWNFVCRVPASVVLPNNEEGELPPSARCCHWLRSGGSSLLVITDAHYGTACCNIPAATVVWRIPARNGAIGRSCLSPRGDLLAVHNIVDGFDVFCVKTTKLIRTYSHQPTHLVALPVMFLHGGKTLLTGSDMGSLHLYDVGTTLLIGQVNHAADIVQAVASFEGATRRIATGSSERGEDTLLKVWVAPGKLKHPQSPTMQDIESTPQPKKRASSHRPSLAIASPKRISRGVNTSVSEAQRVLYPLRAASTDRAQFVRTLDECVKPAEDTEESDSASGAQNGVGANTQSLGQPQERSDVTIRGVLLYLVIACPLVVFGLGSVHLYLHGDDHGIPMIA